MNPAAEAYDPAFAYEVATIVRHGLRRMWLENEDVIYYLTLYNENQVMPAMPEDVDKGVVEGLYRWSVAPDGPKHRATILFSGSANLAAREAQAQLAEHYDVAAELFSATSYKRLCASRPCPPNAGTASTPTSPPAGLGSRRSSRATDR